MQKESVTKRVCIHQRMYYNNALIDVFMKEQGEVIIVTHLPFYTLCQTEEPSFRNFDKGFRDHVTPSLSKVSVSL